MNRKRILLFLLACFLFLTAEKAAEVLLFTEDPHQMERAADSVFRLEALDERGKTVNTGSAVCLFDDSVLVTNAHVMVNADYLEAYDDQGMHFRVDELLLCDEAVDLAIYRMPEGTSCVPLEKSQDERLRGTKVTAIGSQAGLTNLVTTGVLSGIWESRDGSFLLFTAPIAPGCSGGALLDNHGRVIGIICGTYEKAQNLNLAVPIEEAEKRYQRYLEQIGS